MISILITIAAAFLIGILLGKLVLPVLRKMKVQQMILTIGPNWHQTKSGTPTMGGVIFIGACAVCLLTGITAFGGAEHYFGHLFVFLFALAFGFIGFYDDYIKVKMKRNLGLTASAKMVLQLAVSLVFLLILRASGYLTNDLYIPFAQVSFKITWWLYVPFAVFVIVGTVNAVNLTDGIDGLAAGVTLPVMIYFTVISCCYKLFSLALFPAALAAGLCAFLVYNYHPAKVFMGDTGSLFLGGAVCGMAFALDMPLILILIGLVYIIETVSVIMQVSYFKLTHGKRIFRMTPIHHHFELCGWSEYKIFYVFASVTAILCVVAYLGTVGRVF